MKEFIIDVLTVILGVIGLILGLTVYSIPSTILGLTIGKAIGGF